MIPVFERAKMVHALDHAATAISPLGLSPQACLSFDPMYRVIKRVFVLLAAVVIKLVK
jgi:hypothetical protein